MPPIDVPIRAGYTFVGYFASENGGGTQYYATSGECIHLWDKASAATLYAVWQGNQYTVTFDANGGTGGSTCMMATYGSAMPSISVPVRTGYTFGGYYASPGGSGVQYYTKSGTSARTWDQTRGMTLYAKWMANKYTVKFDPNGGTGKMPDQTLSYDQSSTLAANAFPYGEDCVFMGWALSPSGVVTYLDKAWVKNLTSTQDGVVTLYAVWQQVTSVTVRPRYPWNGLVDIDVTFRATGLSTFSFEVKDTTGNTNLNARTFYLGNPEDGIRTLDVQPGTHRFVWDAAADLGEVVIPSFAVTAKVRNSIHQVNVIGGTGSGSYPQGTTVAITAAAAKTGYAFTAWTGSAVDVGLLANASAATTTFTVPSRDVVFEATYAANTYTVVFHANGGTGRMANESFTYDTAKALTANAFTRTDYSFLGWAESADATMAKYTDQQTVKNLLVSGTKNLYAVWLPGVQLWEDGPYWATCNVGATKPEEYGYYFWWGDTVGYTCEGGEWTYNKYSEEYYYSRVTWVSSAGTCMSDSPFTSCPTDDKDISMLQSQGYIDSTGNLVAKYDAATVHLGAPWRMPTGAEMSALISNCTTNWTTRRGVYGLLVTGKGTYASKSIFLPAAGYGSFSSLYDTGSTGEYWSSTPSSLLAYCLRFTSHDFYQGTNSRRYGNLVRPLRESAK